MRNENMQFETGRAIWTNVVAIVLVWTAVVVLALAGLTVLSIQGDMGALMLVAALVIAAPAAAMSQQRNLL